MKKLLPVILILLYSINAFTQSVIRLRADNYAYSNIKDKSINEYYPWGDWNKCDVLISFDYPNLRLKIFNKCTDDFVLQANPLHIVEEDSKGDIYDVYIFSALDQDGKPCTIRLRNWKKYTLLQIYIYYSNIQYVYEAEPI